MFHLEGWTERLQIEKFQSEVMEWKIKTLSSYEPSFLLLNTHKRLHMCYGWAITKAEYIVGIFPQ